VLTFDLAIVEILKMMFTYFQGQAMKQESSTKIYKKLSMIENAPEDYWSWIGQNRESFLIGISFHVILRKFKTTGDFTTRSIETQRSRVASFLGESRTTLIFI